MKMEFVKLKEPNSAPIRISATTLMGYIDKTLYYVQKTDEDDDDNDEDKQKYNIYGIKVEPGAKEFALILKEEARKTLKEFQLKSKQR
jgi:hypothetical protein